jgi:hypothetical protein
VETKYSYKNIFHTIVNHFFILHLIRHFLDGCCRKHSFTSRISRAAKLLLQQSSFKNRAYLYALILLNFFGLILLIAALAAVVVADTVAAVAVDVVISVVAVAAIAQLQ